MRKFYLYEAIVLILSLSLIISFIHVFYAYKYPANYHSSIINECSIHNVNMDFVCGIIAVESRFKSDVVSEAGAIGVMQIMPNTAIEVATNMIGMTDFEVSGLYVPNINIAIGVRYLRYLMDKFGNIRTVLAAYNAGEGNVSIWLNDPNYSSDGKTILTTPFKETNAYIENVLNAFKIYRNKQPYLYNI